MRPQIPVPSKGQPLRATWGSQVANRVNELCAMAPASALHREGFGGMGDQALPKNLRDRTGGAGRPMPFDITAKLQSNQDGTQKRLVIACINGAVNWCGPGFTAHQDDTPGVLTDVAPEKTVYTGEWASAISSGTYTVFLNYKLSLAPEWDTAVSPLAFDTAGTKIYQKITAEKIAAPNDGPSTLPYGDCGLYFLTGTQVLVSWLRLGQVTVSSSGAVSVTQAFHGDLLLSDLLTIADGSGGGEDPTNGTTYPMPFQYKRTDTEDPETGEITSSYSITNCNFYWDGVYYSIADFVPPADGSVYLKATKSGTGAGAWSFSLVTSPVANPTGDNQTIRLYDFSGSRIVMDYRTTTLTFGPGPRDYFEVKKPDGSVKASLDATGTSAKATIEGATHDVLIDAADATQDDVQLRECDYYDGSSSTPTKVNILTSKALTLCPAPNLAVVTGMSFKIENNKLKATLDKTNLRTGETSTEDVNICDVHDLDVVTNTDYTNPNFTQSKQSVTVIGTAPSTSPTPTNVFTSTPLTAES